MPLLQELGSAVRQRRQEIGLSQDSLASIAGLSRATVVNLENGSLENLSSTRIERLANSLGFSVGLLTPPKRDDAMESAARLASVPYRRAIPAEVLHEALVQGSVPPGFIPQVRTFLQEAPVATLAAVVEQLGKDGPGRNAAWARMRALAAVLKCDRPLWSPKST